MKQNGCQSSQAPQSSSIQCDSWQKTVHNAYM
jgi:hypothetical protein